MKKLFIAQQKQSCLFHSNHRIQDFIKGGTWLKSWHFSMQKFMQWIVQYPAPEVFNIKTVARLKCIMDHI